MKLLIESCKCRVKIFVLLCDVTQNTIQKNKEREIMQIYRKQHYDRVLERVFAPLLDESDLLTQLRANTILAKGERYFDFTASGLAYKKIEKRLDSILPYYANTHSRFATHSAFMSAVYERAKERLKEMLGLGDEFVLIAGGSGASFGIKKFQELMGHSAFMSAVYERAKERLKEMLGLGDEFVLIAGGSGASFGIKKFQELMGIYVPPQSLAHFNSFFQGINDVKTTQDSSYTSQNPLLERLRIYDKQTKALNLPSVLLSGFEHHSNEISFREGLCHIHKIDFNEYGLPDVEHLEKMLQNLKGEKIIASLSVASNVTGLFAPIESYSKLLRKNRAIIAFDMASSSPYLQIDSALYDAAFLAPHKLLGGVGSCGLLAIRKSAFDMASSSPYLQIDSALYDAAFLAPHKLLGGVGSCGLLAIRKSLCDTQIPPSFAGGGVMEYANDKTHSFIDDEALREEAGTPQVLGLLRAALAYSLRNEIGFAWIKRRKKVLMHSFIDDEALREEAGTPQVLGLLRAALAYSLRNEIGFAWIKRRKKVLMEIFLHELKKIPAVSIYGDLKAERLGIISFNVGLVCPLDLSMLLSKKYGIQTRAGCSCAGPYGHYLLGEGSKEKKPMWLRVSIHYTHALSDIEYLVESIKSCVKILRG